MLETIAELSAVDGASLTDIARACTLNMSTAHRYLSSLEAMGYIERHPETLQYRLGRMSLHLGTAALSQIELRDIASEHLNDVMRQTNEAVHLALLDGSDIVYIDKVDSPQVVRMWSRVGVRLPAYCTAAGKAILAFLSPRDASSHIPPTLEQKTPNTLTTREALDSEFKKIQHLGYAIDDCENMLDIRCVGAPIFDHEDRVVASISVSAPSSRLSLEKAKRMGPLVRDVGLQISVRLGNHSPVANLVSRGKDGKKYG